ncbi:SAM and PH domain-containing protein [Hirsutella rhossiliensis]|uniref:SAM and PH domain-containing protein n=1 Tax=Hirsutella rhossiliensis TaxID=111463 RepID=A0A9P8MXV7_9HYPO|nr:SAM and PH domain-containing protein [Hirsutella rhossiliensis]KAH0963240.1 SAM and PH domain-containing protein [Hirsutella rhossiliensis]
MDHPYFRVGDGRISHQVRNHAAEDAFLTSKLESHAHRPMSVATEFVDTDWDEEIVSDVEDNSPRVSLQSSGQPSITTVSSYDEVPTPRSSRGREVLLDVSSKQVQGPRGPHLFRSSTDQSLLEEGAILTLSPLTSRPARVIDGRVERSQPPAKRSSFQYDQQKLDPSLLASWTPEMVAQSMLDAGIELSVAYRFIENDINGEIVVTLKFEDLKELDIPSFGIRTKVWNQIEVLRNSRRASPRPSTPIEDVPSREARRAARAHPDLERRQGSRRTQRRRPSANDDIVTPMESVSIIGIEQVIPRPHHCSKGENCSKWKRHQRAMEEIKKAHPNVDLNAGGTVLLYGDAGNPDTAKAIIPNEDQRPMSDALQSVVASSDVLGPGGLPPLQYLREAALLNVQSRDPQDNVRQFLGFQHQQSKTRANEVPPTPPFELTPATKPPHHGLRWLPKLSIPDGGEPQQTRTVLLTVEQALEEKKQRQSIQQQGPPPQRMDKSSPRSLDLETPRDHRRLASPFSEVDVPVTAVPLGPVARNVSQSVPPDMGYRADLSNSPPHARSQSRLSARRPSFSVLPALDEHKASNMAAKAPSPKSPSPSPNTAGRLNRQPRQAPPRYHYPWSPEGSAAADGISFQGPMKKRKMRLFRHEWQDGYFTIRGTRLNMHKDSKEMNRTLEYVDIDDYAIACSNFASSSKLSAAFKAMNISHSRGKSDSIAAFSFQLIPQDKEVGARLRKRDSFMHAPGAASDEGVNGTGKTHHFAVKGRDERIDWMRELMLAKALKQKGQGFEISVNGNMI